MFELSNLLWLPRDSVNVSDFEVDYSDDYGRAVHYVCWEARSGEIGVPRAFAGGLDFVDKTTRTPAAFPEFRLTLTAEQDVAVRKVLQAFEMEPGGTLKAKPGTGKTIMGLWLAKTLGLKTLVLVNTGVLQEQWIDRYELCFGDREVGLVRQTKCDFSKTLTVSTFQTCYSRIETLPSEFWNGFGLVIVDEGHHTAAETFLPVVRKLNPHKFLALTATPERSDGLEFLVDWHVGPIVAECKRENLTGTFVQKEIEYPDPLVNKFRWWARGNLTRMVEIIAGFEPRNEWIIAQAKRALEKGRKVLVLSDRVAHCERLQRDIEGASLVVGSLKGKKLEDAKEAPCIVATYRKLGEGADIPTVDTLFLATPRGKITQPVGRIQRIADKKPLVVVDFWDKIEGIDSGDPSQKEVANASKRLLDGMKWSRHNQLIKMGFTKA